ncbi:substrate-binding periplasmic protein [Kiloniella sp.]|uniref:substrate-binding periplasmic protein n=1 Tax=Kiloniella sp. TaxID=1938587 RepID=UPI003B01D422
MVSNKLIVGLSVFNRTLAVYCFVLISSLFSLLFPAGLWAEEPTAQQKIPFLTYHVAEPFIVNTQARLGLTYELADVLSDRSEGRYKFEVFRLPRLELNERLKQDPIVVIPWVNPAWFGDINQTKYLWTEGYQEDSNSIISSPNNPIEYRGPASLEGLTVAGQEGAKWVGLESLIKDGRMIRVTTSNYWDTMRMVYFEKVDAGLLPTPIAKYLLAKKKLAGRIHFSTEPHSRFQRHLLTKGDDELYAFLKSQIPFLRNSKEWKSIMARYGQ